MRSQRQQAGKNPDAGADVLKHLAAALPQQWRRYRKKLKRCREHFSEKRVHDTRVEIRRLLATVELLRVFLPGNEIKPVRRALKEHLDIFDQLRDTQVQLAYVEGMLAAFPSARVFQEWLLAREERFRRQTRQAVKQIRTKRLDRRLAALGFDLNELPVSRPPSRCLDQVLQAVALSFARVGQLRRQIKAADTSTIHRTRVAFKRFRYMLEALAPVFSAIDDPLRAAMHDYQTMMGDIQDAEVLLATLDKCIRSEKAERRSFSRLRHALLKRRQRLVEVYLQREGKLYSAIASFDEAFIALPTAGSRYKQIAARSASALRMRRTDSPMVASSGSRCFGHRHVARFDQETGRGPLDLSRVNDSKRVMLFVANKTTGTLPSAS